MGADIHPFVICDKRHLEMLVPFTQRSYGKFAFLAGVRNYSGLPAQPWWGRGFPEQMSCVNEFLYQNCGYHSATWVSVDELIAFDYKAPVEDRRVTIGGDGGCTAKPGGGEMTTYERFLGPDYLEELSILRAVQLVLGKLIVAYAFDN